MDNNLKPIEMIAEFLRAHELSVSYHGEWVYANGMFPADVDCEKQYENWYRLQLNVSIAVDEHTAIYESFGGMAENRDQAVKDAIVNFVYSCLHPVLAAFYGKESEQVTTQTWQSKGTAWKATIGDYVIRNPESAKLEIPKNVISTIEHAVKDLELGGSIHWIRLYYGHSYAQNTTSEVILDNEYWEAAQDQIAKLDWPDPEGFYGVRLFLILQQI